MQFTRLFDILDYQAAKYPNLRCLSVRNASGDTHHFSTAEIQTWVHHTSRALLAAGFQSGDRGAIYFYRSHPWWNILDLAMLQIGMEVVPLHASIGAPECRHILAEADIKIVFSYGEELQLKMETLLPAFPQVQLHLSLNDEAENPLLHWVLSKSPSTDPGHLKLIRDAIQPSQTATIIYTSGTTGQPKGVMLSHDNIVCNVKSVIALMPVSYRHRAVSVLPLSHIFERTVTYAYLSTGASVYYLQDMDNLSAALRQIKPHFMTAVPRLLEGVYEKIEAKAEKSHRFGRWLIRWAIRQAERFWENEAYNIGATLQWWIADLIVFRVWRRMLGGQIKGIMVGAAALQPRLNQIFSGAGIPIKEGYGLTEASPVVSLNRFEAGGTLIGSAGIPIPGVEVKIHQADEKGIGEIWVKGPNIMQGYLKNPEATAKAIDTRGWLHTGDIGYFERNKFLVISDRESDLIKTSSGKFISPTYLENHFRSSPFIDDIMIIGHNRSFVTALVLPAFTVLEAWADKHKVHWTSAQFMVHNPKIERHIKAVITELNQSLESHEIIRKFHLCFEPWTIEGGQKTPTLKLRRRVMNAQFEDIIDDLYK